MVEDCQDRKITLPVDSVTAKGRVQVGNASRAFPDPVTFSPRVWHVDISLGLPSSYTDPDLVLNTS
jgi:hypothetical protein